MSRLVALPGARTYTYTGPDQSWRAHVKQNNAGCELRLELFGLGAKKTPELKLFADDWKGVEKLLRRLGGAFAELGKSLADVKLQEPT